MMMGHGSLIFTVVWRFASNRQSMSLHDITGVESSVHYRYPNRTRNPAVLMGHMLCDSLSRMGSANNLVDILRCCQVEIDLPMLGAMFFERGLLASELLTIHPIERVTLGDIGYVTEAGNFVVVDNVHQYLQAESGTLSFLTGRLEFRSGLEGIS
jgi:hypothetical protein